MDLLFRKTDTSGQFASGILELPMAYQWTPCGLSSNEKKTCYRSKTLAAMTLVPRFKFIGKEKS